MIPPRVPPLVRSTCRATLCRGFQSKSSTNTDASKRKSHMVYTRNGAAPRLRSSKSSLLRNAATQSPKINIERGRMPAEYAAMRQRETKLVSANWRKPERSRSTTSRERSPPIVQQAAARTFSKNIYIPILFDSHDFVCINKPPSLLSQPGLPGEGTIIDLLRYQRPDLKLQTVNRLDKNTSGAMVLGRTESAVRTLNLLFKENKIEKNYLALLKPKPGSPLYTQDLRSCRALALSSDDKIPFTTGVLIQKTKLETGKLTITQSPESTTSGQILTYDPETESFSISHFHVLSRIDEEGKVFVLYTPLTGKKHQLRLHSAFLLGAPVVGDHRYGYPQDDGMLASMRVEDKVYKDGYALHCYRIASSHKSLCFDVTAGFPDGRWGDIWDCVKSEVIMEGFSDRIRRISKAAKDTFLQDEVKQLLADPKLWAKGIKGQRVKKDL